MVEQCQAESAKGSPVAEGGCEAEAKGVVYQGDYEIWTNSLVRCPKDKDVQILWSGYKDDEREDIFESLRSAGGCLAQREESRHSNCETSKRGACLIGFLG